MKIIRRSFSLKNRLKAFTDVDGFLRELIPNIYYPA